MKHIEALIPNDRIQDVGLALMESGIKGLTLTTVYCPGQETGEGSKRGNRLLGVTRCKLDVLISDDEFAIVQSVLRKCLGADSRVSIISTALETTIRIRTGESQEAALR